MKLKLNAGIIAGFLMLFAAALRPSFAAPPAGYTVVWQDNFPYPAPTPPPTPAQLEPSFANWSFDTGAGGWGNNELETYIADPPNPLPPGAPPTTLASIEHCLLVQDPNSPNGNASALQINTTFTSGNWASARIKTEASAAIGSQPQYGYIESAIKFNAGQGLFPSWFMVGADRQQPGGPTPPFGPWPPNPNYQVGWPECGEIDLLQLYDVADPTAPFSPGTLYSDEQSGTANGGIGFNEGTVTYDQSAYNVYGFLWTPTTMTNFYNGSAYDSGINPGGPFDQPFYILYDIAVGGNYGSPPANSPQASMNISYVRVYQLPPVQTVANWTQEDPAGANVGLAPFVIPTGDPNNPVGNPYPWQLAPRSEPASPLQLYGGQAGNGYGIFIQPPGSPNATANPTWDFFADGGAQSGNYKISPAPGVCLQAGGWSGGSLAHPGSPDYVPTTAPNYPGRNPGSYAEAWACGGSGNTLQDWNVVPVPDPSNASPPKYYQIQPASSAGLCLTANDNISNITNGNYPVTLEGCTTDTNDEWEVLPFVTSVPGSQGFGAGFTGPIVTASGGTSGVTLNWTTYDGSTRYNIYRGTVPGGEGATPATSVAVTASPPATENKYYDINTYVDTDVTDYVTYYYEVSAVNTNGEGLKSNEVSGIPGPSPSPPTNLTAAPGNSTSGVPGNPPVGNPLVYLNWTPSAGALTYNIFRGNVPTGESPTPIATGVASTSYTDTGVVVNSTYYYVVSAVNSTGQSPYSGEANATPVPKPTSPANLTATAGNATVTLNWSGIAVATSYSVYRGVASGGEAAAPIYSTTNTSYTDNSTLNGTTYYYTVVAFNVSGSSDPSNQASATPEPPLPAAPTNLTATAGNGQVTLNWTAASTAGLYPTSYDVYQGTAAGQEAATPVQTGISATSTVVANLTNDTTYFFTVASVNGGGTSGPSLEASATPRPLPPLAPTNLAASPGNASVTLTWTASAGASSYNVYVGQSPGGESSNPILQVTVPTAFVSGLTDGTTYYFIVKAVNTGGISPASNEVSFTPSPPPPAPTNLSATGGVGQVTLNWSGVSSASSYSVFMGTTSKGESLTATLSGLTVTTAVVTGLNNGTTYYFTVEALNIGGASSGSNEASATPEGPVPPAPTNLTATAAPNLVTLNWTASANGSATSYNVYMGTSPGGETHPAAFPGIAGTQYGVPGLTNGVTYYFVVTGVNPGGEGAPSTEVSATPGITVTIPHGIQLFSVPYDYTATNPDPFTVGSMYVWLPTQFEYHAMAPTAANLKIGVGYWANLPQDVVFTPGIPASTAQPFSISLSAGWNQVGDPFQKSVPISSFTFNGGETFDAAVSSGLIGQSVWKYDPTANGGLGAYADAVTGDNALDVGSGYWVYATAATVMQVPPPQ